MLTVLSGKQCGTSQSLQACGLEGRKAHGSFPPLSSPPADLRAFVRLGASRTPSDSKGYSPAWKDRGALLEPALVGLGLGTDDEQANANDAGVAHHTSAWKMNKLKYHPWAKV